MKRIILAAVALTFSGLATASAAPASKWVKVPTSGGCFYYELAEDAPEPGTYATSVWTGPCTRGQPINGSGTMTDTTPYIQDNYEGPQSSRMVMTETFSGGYRNGPYTWERASQWNHLPAWVVRGGNTETAKMGCDLENGQPKAGCTPAVVEGDQADNAARSETPTGCQASPDAALACFNRDLEAARTRHPMPQESAGARAIYQYSYAFATEGLGILSGYQTALGSYYKGNYDALVGMQKSGHDGCNALSSSNADCQSTYPQ